MNRKLTEIEKVIVDRLTTKVTFLPASYDKRFCRGLSPDAGYSEKQIAFIHKLFHKYRRQIYDYESIKQSEV
jgi:hypothetical protein